MKMATDSTFPTRSYHAQGRAHASVHVFTFPTQLLSGRFVPFSFATLTMIVDGFATCGVVE